jgi:murein DD-endopeptidase MepM/ murein hydrolase activator NlpD
MRLFYYAIFFILINNCYSMDFYRIKVYEILCRDCGEAEIDCNKFFENNQSINESLLEFPVGFKNAERFYIAQNFGEINPRFRNRYHLGEDWNYIGGGDSDFGAPVYSIGKGVVSMTKDLGGGWGKVIRICHRLSAEASTKLGINYIESVYAHLSAFHIQTGDIVERGRWVGSIGNSNQAYPSHLHFELRSVLGEDLGGGYESEIPIFYLKPSLTIDSLYSSE